MMIPCIQILRRRQVVSISGRLLSDWSRGTDLLAGSLTWGDSPKVILDGYSSSGFDVINVVQKVGDETEESDGSGAIHMMGSILAFPHACFLWNVTCIDDVTAESLAPAILHRPKLEYLFIGSDRPMSQERLNRIKTEFRKKEIVVEQFNVGDAMGTFNILNGEDRPVAAALVLHNDDTSTTNSETLEN